jgi:hypothetical protein
MNNNYRRLSILLCLTYNTPLIPCSLGQRGALEDFLTLPVHQKPRDCTADSISDLLILRLELLDSLKQLIRLLTIRLLPVLLQLESLLKLLYHERLQH